MQEDVEGVAIIGINQYNYEYGNDTFTHGRDIPWLQETETDSVWADWMVTYRDVIIVDADGYPVDVYNLTEHDLSVDADYAALKNLLLAY